MSTFVYGLDVHKDSTYATILDVLDDEVKLLSKQLKELAEDNEDVKLLRTIPAIGYYSSLLAKSEIDDINSFPFGDRLCSYAGWCLPPMPLDHQLDMGYH